MKKFTKSGHLQGNTNVSFHSTPFIHSPIPMDTLGYITDINALSAGWNLELVIQTDDLAPASLEMVLSDSGTNAGALADIVSVINNHPDNQNYVVASVLGGSLLLKTTSSGHGSFIRIMPSTGAFPSSAVYFGFSEYPHSQSTVYAGDIKGSSTDTLGQQNPPGTKFIANGEDRTSESYNRALAATSANMDANESMLARKLAVQVTLKLEVDQLNLTDQNDRFIVDPVTNRVKAINLSSAIADSFSTMLESRVLVGTLNDNSTLRQLRELFQITDHEGKEISSNGYPVRISGATTGSAPGQSPAGPFTLESQPNLGAAPSPGVGQGGNVLGVDIPRDAGTQSVSITGYLDKYTIECSGATFITGNVAKGDKLTIAGASATSWSNNGDYIVENVISETVIEVKPYHYSDIAFLETISTGGTVSVSTGGMWLKDVVLWLTEPMQLPLNHNVYVSVPLEEITGDLPEDALIKQDLIEVPWWVVSKISSSNLDTAYKGPATSRKAAGYYIDADAKSVEITNNVYERTSQSVTVLRTITNVDIFSDNTVQIAQGSTDFFTDADLGRFLRFAAPNISPGATPADSTLISGELAVIVQMLDSKTVKVRRTSRASTDLPLTANIGQVEVVAENARHLLPGAITTLSTDRSVGGYNTIVEGAANPDGYPSKTLYTNLELERIQAIDPTVPTASIESLIRLEPDSGTQFKAMGVDGLYMNQAYPTKADSPPTTLLNVDYEKDVKPFNTPSLLLRVYNGPNAGFYFIIYMETKTDPVIRVLNLNGDTVSLDMTVPEQWGSLYIVAQGSRALTNHGPTLDTDPGSQLHITGTNKRGSDHPSSANNIGISVTWKGPGAGISVYSNLNAYTAAEAGMGSTGTNIDSFAGPGSDGITSVAHGITGFDNANLPPQANVSISNAQGLGGKAIYGKSTTYHLDIKNRPDLTGIIRNSNLFQYYAAAGFFEGTSPDPALVVSAITQQDQSPTRRADIIHIKQLSSAAAVVINNNYVRATPVELQQGFGKIGNALSVYGNIYSSANIVLDKKEPNVMYTESTGSFVAVYASEPKGILDVRDKDNTTPQPYPTFGSPGIIGRLFSTSEGSIPAVINSEEAGLDIFNTTFDLAITLFPNQIFGSNNRFNPFLHVQNLQDLIGAYVFFTAHRPDWDNSLIHATALDAIVTPTTNQVGTLPFHMADEKFINGLRLGFKIVAARKSNTEGITEESWHLALSTDLPEFDGVGVPSNLDKSPISCVIYRKRFKGSLDVTSWLRIGSSFKRSPGGVFQGAVYSHNLPAGGTSAHVKKYWASQDFLNVYGWDTDVLLNGEEPFGDDSFRYEKTAHKLPLLTSHPLPEYGRIKPVRTGANYSGRNMSIDLGYASFTKKGVKAAETRLPKRLTPTTYPLSTGTGVKRDLTRSGGSLAFNANSTGSSDSHIQSFLGGGLGTNVITAEHQSGIVTSGSIGIPGDLAGLQNPTRISFQKSDILLWEESRLYTDESQSSFFPSYNDKDIALSGVCGNFGMSFDALVNFPFPRENKKFVTNFRTGLTSSSITELQTTFRKVIRGRAFCGGGSKLVLSTNYVVSEIERIESSVKEDPLPKRLTKHYIYVKVGANHIDNKNGIRLILSVSNSHPTKKRTIYASLTRETSFPATNPQTGVASAQTSKLHCDSNNNLINLNSRGYETVEFVFAKHEVEAMYSVDNEHAPQGFDINRTDQDQSLYIKLSFETEGGLHAHPEVNSLTLEEKEALGAALGWMPLQVGSAQLGGVGPGSGETGTMELIPTPTFDWSYNLNLFPEVYFINSISVVTDQDHALLTTGMDIHGAARARSLRLLSAVTGHQVVSPANAELLQNTEFGNKRGSGMRYEGSDARDLQFKMDNLLGTNYSHNLEGNSVGLVPLWFASQSGRSASTGDDYHHLMKPPQASTGFYVAESGSEGIYYQGGQQFEMTPDENSPSKEIFVDRANMQGNIQSDANYKYILSWNDNTSVVFSGSTDPYHPSEGLQYDPGALATFSATTIDGEFAHGDKKSFARMGMFASVSSKGLRYVMHGWTLWNETDWEENKESALGINDDKIPIVTYKLFYKAAFCYTRFYKPKFDLGSVFKKGVHSAAIHAHIPYFDPLFYWESCMAGIDFGRVLERDGGIMQKGVLYTRSTFTEGRYSGGNMFNKFNIGSYRRGHVGAQGGGTTASPDPYNSLDTEFESQYDSTYNSQALRDAFQPCGRTGFLIPIDPPHGSLLTGLDLNISFRPMVGRNSYQNEGGGSSTDTRDGKREYKHGGIKVDYGVYFDYPTPKRSNTAPVDFTGSDMRGRNGWQEKEGYLLRIWRHSPFAQGFGMGDSGSSLDEDSGTSGFTSETIEMEGHATLIYEQVVRLREDIAADGGIASKDLSTAVDTAARNIKELMSRPRVRLGADDGSKHTNLLMVDRANYSYFVTIEFYTGVRKLIGENTSNLNFTIPGLFYNDNISKEASNHFPYMWTPAFPGDRPNAMSSVWGNDPASRWEGYWEPFPNYAGFEKRHHNSVHVGHPLNISYGGPKTPTEAGSVRFEKTDVWFTGDRYFDQVHDPSVGDPNKRTSEFTDVYGLYKHGAVSPTLSTSLAYPDSYGVSFVSSHFNFIPVNEDSGTQKLDGLMFNMSNYSTHTDGDSGYTNYYTEETRPNGRMGLNGPMPHLLNENTHVHDSTVWYPVIKFRGLRITYQMDRPGHGGWGG